MSPAGVAQLPEIRRTLHRNDPTMLDHPHFVKRRNWHPAAVKS